MQRGRERVTNAPEDSVQNTPVRRYLPRKGIWNKLRPFFPYTYPTEQKNPRLDYALDVMMILRHRNVLLFNARN